MKNFKAILETWYDDGPRGFSVIFINKNCFILVECPMDESPFKLVILNDFVNVSIWGDNLLKILSSQLNMYDDNEHGLEEIIEKVKNEKLYP